MDLDTFIIRETTINCVKKWPVEEGVGVDDYWQCISDKINRAVDKCIPLSKASRGKKKCWITAQATRSILEKKKAWKKYTYCKNEKNFNNYVLNRNHCTRDVRYAKRESLKESSPQTLKMKTARRLMCM